MRQLAVSHPTQGSMKAGKKERKANKTTFKSLLASLERGAPPTTRVKLQKGDTLTVSSWEGHTQLNALRTYLAGGFQVSTCVCVCVCVCVWTCVRALARACVCACVHVLAKLETRVPYGEDTYVLVSRKRVCVVG